MGGGDFGSDGSVHWSVRHTGGGGPFSGIDPVSHGNIGNASGHAGTFLVRLKFANDTVAREAVGAAKYPGNGFVTIEIPKIDPQRDNPIPPEVSVDW